MTGVFVTGFAFLTGFLAIFGINLVVTDVFLKDRDKVRSRLEAEAQQRHRKLAREALAGKDLDQLAAEAMRETGDNKTLLEKIGDMIEQSGTGFTIGKLLAACLALGTVVGVAVGFLSGSFVLGPLIGLAAAAMPFLYVQVKQKQRMDRMLSQLPDALELMSRILRAGQTISQAMLAVATEFRAPIAPEFGYCYEQQNLGLNMDVALRDMATRTGLLEMRIFVLGLLIHRRAGGNLTELLDNLANIIRERQKIRGKIRAMTAEGRFQAIILLILPVIAFLGLFVVARDYATKLFEHPWLLIGSVISMGIGAAWIRRIVNFDF